MIDYQMMQKDKNSKIRALHQYLRENQVGVHLAVPVQKQAEDRLQGRQRLAESDVQVLSVLSSALRQELRFAIQRPHLERHPLFRLWMALDLAAMERACFKGMEFIRLRATDNLFQAGSLASSMYFVTNG